MTFHGVQAPPQRQPLRVGLLALGNTAGNEQAQIVG